MTRSQALAGLALAALATALITLVATASDTRRLWGDEGTYVAMTASLVREGDLAFREPDRLRLEEHVDDPAPTVILQRTNRGITYSKPVLYPLLAALPFAVSGEAGLVATNALLLIAALMLAWLYLRPVAGSRGTAWILTSFVLGSVVVVYIGWKMSDLALLSLTLAGLVLALGGRQLDRGGRRIVLPFGTRAAAIVGGLLLGASATMRFTSAALVAAVALALIVDHRWRRALIVGIVSALGFVVASGATHLLLGTANPYKAERSSFNETTGYPAGATLEQAAERFTTRPATQSATWRPPVDLRRTAYSALYFFVGRHSGLLFYFPAACLLLTCLLRRPDGVALSMLAGIAVILGFYLVWMPQNYFGGSTFVGNRYFLGAFPALLVAVTRPPSRRALAITWLIALAGWGSATHSARLVHGLDHSSQRHVHAGLFRWLPFESTAQRIDGVTDRFWADDFVRFLDPFGSPSGWRFHLDSRRPPTEILVATDWDDRPLHFVVSPDSAEVAVEVRDWRGRWRTMVPRSPPDPPGLLAVSASPAWRRHAYWWKPGRSYGSRVLRLSLVDRATQGATAVVRYAGRGRELAPLSAEMLALDPPLPERPRAATSISLEVRNTGRRPWRRGGLFPVGLGYRLISGAQGRVEQRGSVPLPHDVGPGETVETDLGLSWPDQPGTYQLVFDLLREPVGDLGRLGRLVLWRTEVVVEAPISPDSPTP